MLMTELITVGTFIRINMVTITKKKEEEEKQHPAQEFIFFCISMVNNMKVQRSCLFESY